MHFLELCPKDTEKVILGFEHQFEYAWKDTFEKTLLLPKILFKQ